MSDFKREERYIVFKIKDLTLDQTCDLRDYIAEQGIKAPECVVVESDWPNYEHVWQTIEQAANGTFDPDEITRLQAANRDLQHWFDDARATAERLEVRVAELKHLCERLQHCAQGFYVDQGDYGHMEAIMQDYHAIMRGDATHPTDSGQGGDA